MRQLHELRQLHPYQRRGCVSDRRIGNSEFRPCEVFPMVAETVTSTRYPFLTEANRFLSSYVGVYSDGMMHELQRRYPKIDRQFHELWKARKVSTMDPRYLTAQDIKEYIIFQRNRGLKDTSICNDVCAISNVCKFSGENICVDMARVRYPMLFQKHRKDRLPVMEKPIFKKLFSIANSLTPASGYLTIRAYALTALAVCAGLRTQEIQFAKIEYLDPSLKFIFLDHVKGMDSYGTARTVPIRPECVQIVQLYLSIRNDYVNSKYLFANEKGKYFSGNTLRKDKNKVCFEIEFDFDFRMMRRTYAQYLIDEGIPIEWVSVVLGHSSSKTTEKSYARPREDRVVRSIADSWLKLNETGVKI